ncbi:MAG TPA: hypothetical protein VNQ97_15670, partial [Burkholderiaceae bacterium]|nr:hypothetical protein [Burkholderiaceae bacterium]
IQAEARAMLAAETISKRLRGRLKLRIDLIGATSIFGDDDGELLRQHGGGAARDVRLRIAGAHAEKEIAEQVLREVTALYTCGPAGGGGVRTALRPRLNSISSLIPRELAPASWSFTE